MLLPKEVKQHIYEQLRKATFILLKKLYQERFVKSPLFMELVRDLKSTVVEFRFLKQAQIIKEKKTAETSSRDTMGAANANYEI